MPGTYAHYSFGIKVFDETDNHITRIIATNLDLFLLGLHGTDIFSFYKPLQNNKINQIPYDIFSQAINTFFINAKKIILNSTEKEQLLSYILGFICYFILNNQCNPYINKISYKTEFSLKEIESEFDKFILIKNRKNPLKVDLVNHLSTDIEIIEYICPFFNVEKKYIKSAIESMKSLTSLYTTSNKLVRFIALKILKFTGNYDEMQGLFFYSDRNTKCKKECEELYNLYNKSIEKSIIAMDNFYDFLYNKEPLSCIFL
ncbi:MAG: hypothetical protein RRY11_01935 [Terrisporobacter sp.]